MVLAVTGKWGLLLGLLLGCGFQCWGQTLPNGGKAVYNLIDGSVLTDDCPICGRPTIPVPMRGSFQLSLANQGPLFLNYLIENISFVAALPGGLNYTAVGHGTYRIGGELAVNQSLELELTISDGATSIVAEFTNATSEVTRLWPMIQIPIEQTNGTPVQQFHLLVNAAPFRELWFSTRSNFVASLWNSPTNTISNGDLLSSSGRVVKRNSELVGRLGVQPPVPELGLKDVDVLPGGEIVFSTEQDMFSETLGKLLSQDVLSDRGRIVLHSVPDLITNFQPQAPVPASTGLAALQFMDDGEVYFSVTNPFVSSKLGVTVQPGDLLSDNGTIVRSGVQLLEGFGPQNLKSDPGLKAIFAWPNGEVWFSTRDGFSDTNGAVFSSGDILSDKGYVVLRNAELLRSFSPSSTNDSGLDALFIISDVVPVTATTTLSIHPAGTNAPPGSQTVSRAGGQRTFQLESSDDLTKPFVPVGPITTDVSFHVGATNQSRQFYRLHQW
jgi:hypothetical protein